MVDILFQYKDTPEVLMKIQESHYPSPKCCIYESKQNQIPEDLAMLQTAPEGCKCSELKPGGNSQR